MSVVTLLVIVLTAMTISVAVAGYVAVALWRKERLRFRLLTERLMVEGRIEALTLQTLQSMRAAARQHWTSREKQ